MIRKIKRLKRKINSAFNKRPLCLNMIVQLALSLFERGNTTAKTSQISSLYNY